MKKWLLIATAILVGLSAAVAVIIAQNLESYLNDNKAMFVEQIETTLGRDIEIGRIGLSFRGGFGVRVEGLGIAEDPQIAEGAFLRARSVEVRVKIIPALFGSYEVARIELVGPEITLVQTPDGLNVATLGGAASEDKAPSDGGSSNTGTGAGAEAAALAIAIFDVTDGRVRYIDATQTPPVETIVEQLDFSASDISTTAPLVFELSAAIGAGASQNLFASGSVGPVDLDEPTGTPVDLTISADGVTGEQIASLSMLAAALPVGLSVTGPLELEASLAGTVSSMAVTTAARADQAEIRFGDSFHKPVGAGLRFSLSATRTLEAVTLDESEFVLGPARTAIAGTVTTGEAISYDLRAVAQPFTLAEMSRLAPDLAQASLSGKMEFDLRITSAKDGAAQIAGSVGLVQAGLEQPELPSISGITTTIKLAHDSVELPATTFRIGDAEARASASISHFTAPSGTVSLSAPMLTPAALGLSEIGRDGDHLEQIDLQARLASEGGSTRVRGTLTSPSGRVAGIDYDNLSAKFVHADGRMKLEPATLSAFGGSVEANGSIGVGEEAASDFDLRISTRGVDIKEVSAWTAPSADRLLGGTLDAGVNLRGSAGAWEQMRGTLDGNGKLSLRDGRIEDINVAEDVLHAITGVPGLSTLLSPNLRKNYPGMFSSGSTEFEEIKTSLDLNNGRITTRDLALRALDYTITADGTIGLDRQVDLAAQLIASKNLSRDLIDSVGAVKYLTDRNGRVDIPFTLRGDVTSAKARPDSAVIARALQRALIGGLTDQLFGGSR
jgi:uncharacterized protein involved in outer membrane biogenesis